VTRSAQAIILAAGKGTRMKSRRAKVLHAVLGVPLLEHVLRTVEATGAEPVTIVVGHEAAAVEETFAARATFVRQDPPLGTGHALQTARARFAAHPERTLLVVNGDLPLLRSETLLALLDAHARSAAGATLLTARLEDAGDYGRVVRGADGGIAEIVEAKDARSGVESREINVGAYAFEVPALLGVLGRLSRDNAQGEYYLTDLVRLLAAEGQRVSACDCADRAEASGVNSLAELAEAAALLRRRRAQELMASGAVIEDPGSTTIGLDVLVEAEGGQILFANNVNALDCIQVFIRNRF
jgi:bifunctional UDP-N-acetylglucosamine pyrophosphorylase/glucosamine-1-phosphate N-acetyltransferase